MAEKDIVKIAQDFEKTVQGVLSEDLKNAVEVVVQAVLHETIQERPGIQVSDEFVWSEALKIQEKLNPLLNSSSQNNWGRIYNFLYDKIGKAIEEEEDFEEKVMDAWSDLQNKNGFKTSWSLHESDEMPPDLKNTVFPLPIKVLVYDSGEGSGWGKSGQINLPENATYYDVWKAANDLIVLSGDLHHMFIEDFLPMRAPNLQVGGMYSIITGS